VTFNLEEIPKENLWLDYAGLGVGYVSVNGTELKIDQVFNGH